MTHSALVTPLRSRSHKMIGPLLTAMVTPFNADDTLALDEAGRLAQWLIEQGNDGVVVAGTTGESPALSLDEKLALFEAVISAVDKRGSVVANTGGNDTRSSIALTKRATALGADGILAVVPYYNKPSQDGMLLHFGAIAESTDLPIILYNIPSRTGVDMSAATLLELARRHDNIAGVKESSGNFAQFSEILRSRRTGFSFWCGDDPLFLPSLAVGGDGLISVAAHVCARELRELLAAYRAGNMHRATELHLALTPLFVGLFAVANPTPVKWAMQQLGFAVGPVRLPLAPLPPALEPMLEALIAPYRARSQARAA